MDKTERETFTAKLLESPEAKALAIAMLIEWLDDADCLILPSLQAEHLMIDTTRDSLQGPLKPTFVINYPAFSVDVPLLEEEPYLIPPLTGLARKIKHLTGIDRVLINGFRKGKRHGLLFWYVPDSDKWTNKTSL